METKLPSKFAKTIKKYAKRLSKESISNKKNTDFKFLKGSDLDTEEGKDCWYFELDIPSGHYAGQKHIIEFKLIYGHGEDVYIYPKCAPKCSFISGGMWHPNISEKGTICLDTLDNNWSPMMSSSNVIQSIILLLETPEPSSPQNKNASSMFVEDRQGYIEKIKDFYSNRIVPPYVKKMFSDI